MGDGSTWVRFPMIECPACKKEFQVDEAFNDLTPEIIIFCLHCEVEIHVLELNTVIEARISLAEEKEDDGANTVFRSPLGPTIH